MHYHEFNRRVFFILAVTCILSFNFVKSDNDISRVGSFSDAFAQAVANSPQLLQIFDINTISSFEISRITFEEDWVAFDNWGVPFPNSAAKAVADALFVTVNFIKPEFYINAYARSVALYLLSQGLLTPDNAATRATTLANHILSFYPGNDVAENVVNHSTLIRALCIGITACLASTGDFNATTKPFEPMTLVKHFYSSTVIPQPQVPLSVITAADVIPPAVDVYGITAFTASFSAAVDSSAALQGILKVDQSATDVSQAWMTAADTYCASVNCYNEAGSDQRLQNAVAKTYNYLSKSRFVEAISNAYAMSMIDMGTLTVDNAGSSAASLTALLESLLNALPSDAGLEVRLAVVFKALESCVSPPYDIATQYSVFNYNIVLELFSMVPFSEYS